ncbi:MAG TPA: GNAT family N-acetyltransferase [Erysipelotrichaceae bacterium]|jgi:GNAT superfamily N-acetyltransferase|nr:GNAT family N-acetyltransferase [Bacillota bacterium]HCY06397.1 GNAT family N-acetyltransferase [Erysipelotrichaceae bacterium]
MKIIEAKPEDCKIIGDFIKYIAEYEKLLDEVIWDEETLYKELFIDNRAKVLLGKVNDEVVGFVLYFYNFSTFVGRKGLYLEDFYIKKKHRKKGYGKMFFKKLLEIARDNNCGRMEWVCLNWNKTAIDFYKSLNAKPMDEWTTYRLEEHQFEELIKKMS